MVLEVVGIDVDVCGMDGTDSEIEDDDCSPPKARGRF